MAILVNSWPVGIAAALLVLPLVVTSGGLGLAWLAVTLPIGLALLMFVVVYRAPPCEVDPSTLSSGPGRLPFGAVFLAGSIWALYNTALAMVFGFGLLLLSQRGWSLATASSTTSVVVWLIAVSVPLGGFLADRSGRPGAVMASSLLGFAVLLIAAILVPLWAVPAVFIAVGLVSGLPAGSIMSLPSLVLRPGTWALGMGMFFTIYYVAFMVAPALAGWWPTAPAPPPRRSSWGRRCWPSASLCSPVSGAIRRERRQSRSGCFLPCMKERALHQAPRPRSGFAPSKHPSLSRERIRPPIRAGKNSIRSPRPR